MLRKIIEWDEELFLFLNSKHNPWLDQIMPFVSSYPCWIIGALLMLIAIYVWSSSKKKTTSLFFMFTVGMSALITNIIKVIIERPRPIHNVDWAGTINALEGTTDPSYSFFSSHSATTFSMAVFFFLLVRKLKIPQFYGYIAILWAAIVAYSRIYVAKHFPLDVLCGTLFGIAMGVIGYELYRYYINKKNKEI